MERCDFSSVMQVISTFISASESINQTDLLQDFIFDDFFHSKESEDFSLDNGLVCKWLNGTARISPKIIEYYSLDSNKKSLAADIENLIFPALYDVDMAVSNIHDIFINDLSISQQKRKLISEGYPHSENREKANFIAQVLFFGMERSFLKRDSQIKELIAQNNLSPIAKDYIIGGYVPKPCKHFCGRENEIQAIHEMLTEHGKVFVQGVAGIGKSEIVKKYAEVYKKKYTNILYFTYTGDLKQMIANIEFSDDLDNYDDEMKFYLHDRFLRSLNTDTLLIIDNFDTTAIKETALDVVMNYQCKVIFTTRSRFEDFQYIDLKEFTEIDTLLELVGYFYKSKDKHRDIVINIIEEVHRHTFAVELSARLLASGMLNAKQLLRKLQATKTVLDTDDRIGAIKDGKSSQGTYYEHIHTLISLARLSSKSQKIMRNMTLIPPDGICPQTFALWVGLKNLNKVNDLIELGFIQKDDDGNIYLHPLIQEVAIDDTKPSIDNCISLIDTVRRLCMLHGVDLPFHKNLFTIAENVISFVNKDNIDEYQRFLVDVFPYMENYKYRNGMQTIITELEKLVAEGICNNSEQILLYDYKAAFEQKINKNEMKALMYQKKAVELCTELKEENKLLVSNVYSNLGTVLSELGMLDEAREAMEIAHQILEDAGLAYSKDGLTQSVNYAGVASVMGEAENSIEALEVCKKELEEAGYDNSSNYANILWNMGLIYMEMGEGEKSRQMTDAAWEIYNIVWEDEPELLKDKLREFHKFTSALRGEEYIDNIKDYTNLID